MNTKDIAVYAAIVSTITLLWRVFEFIYERRSKRSKLLFSVFYSPRFLKAPLHFIKVHHFTLANIGKQKMRLVNIGHELDTDPETQFSPISQFLNPVELEPGEETFYDVEHISPEFGNMIERVGARKVRMVVTDSVRKTYKSKWVKLHVREKIDN